MKRIHWTQTPEGKKKLAARRKAKANGTYKPNPNLPRNARPLARTDNANTSQEIPSDIFAYALGHTEAWIEAYSKSANISSEVLAAKLGAVLQRKVRR